MTARRLLATYRLQLRKEFPLERAREVVPYLHRLGVSHLYSSPQLRARAGSTHGYDVVDPLTLNPELGTEAERRALVDALHAAGLGMILDIVPNHMGVGQENPYWQDVLTHGPSSAYASWFDIDWGVGRALARTRVLLPVLGKELGEAIENDEIGIAFEGGLFRVTYFGKWFPLDPATTSDILNHDIAGVRDALGDDDPDLRDFDEVVDGLSSMAPRWSAEEGARDERRRRTDETSRRLTALLERSIMFREHVSRAVRTFGSGGDGRRRIGTLLGMQGYELASWRDAPKRINYRRFFDISDLAGVRVEDSMIFADTHRLILEWIRDGSLDGVRVDHIDGLLDPLQYLERLRQVATESSPRRDELFPIFVEKILSSGERLRESWPVQGTTGYEFLNELSTALVSADGSRQLDETFRAQLKLADRQMDFASVAHEGKLRVLGGSLRADVQRVARTLASLANGVAPARSLRAVSEKGVVALVASLPVYRSYIDARTREPHPDDADVLRRALAAALSRDEAPAPILDRMREILLESSGAEQGETRLSFIGRFQQLSGPATAKGVEDTALYRYIPLASLNEVGSAPDHKLKAAVAELHRANALRAEKWPHNLLCTNTHDTKRSADIRSRLHVLAEIPEEWARLVGRWRRAHASLRTTIGRRAAPDAVTEYLMYQTLAGIWPMSANGSLPTSDQLAPIRKRAEAYMIKAAREAKSRTSWTEPDKEFETALKSFLGAILDNSRQFVKEMTSLVSEIARPGLWSALSRVIIHLTAPGTPDLYQGDELWNFSLVDPDNRRPVDYGERVRLLSEIEQRFAGTNTPSDALAELLSSPDDGRIKLYVTWRALQARRAHPAVFSGSYAPLDARGSKADHVIAFHRDGGASSAVTIASRLPRLLTTSTDAPIGEIWGDTTLALPTGRWRCVLSGKEAGSSGEPAFLRELLGSLPVALFIRT